MLLINCAILTSISDFVRVVRIYTIMSSSRHHCTRICGICRQFISAVSVDLILDEM